MKYKASRIVELFFIGCANNVIELRHVSSDYFPWSDNAP
jgi:hypothetical protein